MISESGLWWFVRIATIISLNVNIRRYVCHSIDVRDLIILKGNYIPVYTFVNNVDRSQLPEGIKFELK